MPFQIPITQQMNTSYRALLSAKISLMSSPITPPRYAAATDTMLFADEYHVAHRPPYSTPPWCAWKTFACHAFSPTTSAHALRRSMCGALKQFVTETPQP